MIGPTDLVAAGAIEASRRSEWRETTRRLWAYLHRDMSDALVQRQTLYPESWQRHVLRTSPFVWRLAKELATLYVYPPSRQFGGVAKPVANAAGDEYRRLRLDRKMLGLHQAAVACGNGTLWLWPVKGRDGRLNIRPTIIAPHDQAVQMREGAHVSEEYDDVEAWYVRVPYSEMVEIPGKVYAVAKVTHDRAVWTDGQGTPSELRGRGVWLDDGTNPFSDIPVLHVRASDPIPGEWWAPAHEDILQAQRAINHDLTDVGHVSRVQGYGVPVVSGQTAGKLDWGPDVAVALLQGDGDFKFESARPDLAGYQAVANAYIATVVAANGLNPATLTKSTAITGLAKQLEMMDRQTERRAFVTEFAAAEQRLYDLLRAWHRYVAGIDVWGAAKVEVEYHEPEMPSGTPLHEEQAAEIRFRLGLSGPSKEIARRENVSLEEAKRRHEEYRREVDALGLDGGEVRARGARADAASGTAPGTEDGTEDGT